MKREEIPGVCKAIRERFGLTQSDLAELFDVSVATIGKWEGGRVEPSGLTQMVLHGFTCAMRDDRRLTAAAEALSNGYASGSRVVALIGILQAGYGVNPDQTGVIDDQIPSSAYWAARRQAFLDLSAAGAGEIVSAQPSADEEARELFDQAPCVHDCPPPVEDCGLCADERDFQESDQPRAEMVERVELVAALSQLPKLNGDGA